jgi:hypothetical protein
MASAQCLIGLEAIEMLDEQCYPESARGLAQSKTLSRGLEALEESEAFWSAAVICRFT